MTADAPDIAEALATIDRLRQEDQARRAVIAELERRVAELAAENKALYDQLDEADRRAHRRAAPFRRRESQKVPAARRKPPGRPPGHPAVHRAAPERIDAHLEVPLRACPQCGGAVEGLEPIEQFIEEIPPVRPRVTRLVTYRGHCPIAARCRAPTR